MNLLFQIICSYNPQQNSKIFKRCLKSSTSPLQVSQTALEGVVSKIIFSPSGCLIVTHFQSYLPNLKKPLFSNSTTAQF